MTEEQLSALLRLKRHEQPPSGYFDDLLRDVQRRQREDLLQRPLWTHAIERLQALFSGPSLNWSPATYGGAFAAFVLVGITAIHLTVPVADFDGPSSIGSLQATAILPAETSRSSFALSLQPSQDSLALVSGVDSRTDLETSAHVPRYVIDARPVSYDAPSSF